jgi:PAS domain S-box-containing protein
MQLVAAGGLAALGIIGWLAVGGIFPLLALAQQGMGDLARRRADLERANAALTARQRELERAHSDEMDRLQRQFDRMLQASERQVQALLQGAGSVILAMRPDGTLIEWNQAAEQLYGWKRVAVIGEDYITRFVPAGQQAAVRADLSRVLEGTPVRDVVREVTRPDGSRATLAWNVDRLLDEDGEAIGVVAMGTDISERVAADERFRVLFEASSDPHLLFDEGGIIDCNDAAVRFLRAGSKAEILALHPAVLSPEAQPDGERSMDKAARMDALARAQGHHRFDWVHRRLDGSDVPVEVSLTPVRLTGRPALLVVWHDLTERRAHEAALLAARDAAEDANRAKSTFLAAMSHELRTPLNSIIGFTRQVRKNKYGHLHTTELSFLERVERNGVNLLALINDLLDLTKIEAGRMDLVLAPVDVRTLAAETVAQLEGQPRKPGVVLAADLPEGPVALPADELRLRQVLVNLVGNALKFTHAGSVTVRLSAPADGPVTLDVVDTGIGIAADRLDAIFREFEQAERTTARDYGGTGLGLAISRKLCRMMDAELTVMSTVGVGTTFRVSFATAAAPAALAATPG